MQAASKPYRYKRTTIHLTYFSMPDWLAVVSAAASPAGTESGTEPIVDALRAMATEGDLSILDFLLFDVMEPSERERLFRRLVIGYRMATEQHQKSVADCLDCFTRKGSGRALLAELGRTRYTITVMPHWHYFMALPDNGFRNATPRGTRTGQILSHVTDGIPVNETDTYAKGAPIVGYGTVTRTGTGKGASVVLDHSAGTWTDTIYASYSVGEAGYAPDDVLFHELVHVSRMIRGQQTFATVDGRPNFGNIEEYFVTVITNIYLSEKGQDARLVGVRVPPNEKPPTDWSVMKDPGGFYDNADGLSIPPNQLMDMFKHTQMQFYHDLAVLPTPPKFNPVRTHFNRNQRIPV